MQGEVSLQRAMWSRVKNHQVRDVAIPISESIGLSVTECPKKNALQAAWLTWVLEHSAR